MENFYSIPDIFIDGNEVVYKDYRVNKQELEDNLFGLYCEWLCDNDLDIDDAAYDENFYRFIESEENMVIRLIKEMAK